MQEALEAQKEEFARREDAFRRREEALRRKDLELQESLIKFNKFLQENESKRTRAVKRAADEKKQKLQKEEDLKELEKALEAKRAAEARLTAELARHKRYAGYLQGVADALPEDYPEVADLLNRHGTLRAAHRDLARAQQRREQENEEKQVHFVNLRKEKENEMLNLNNKIAELQKDLEMSQEACLQKQNDIDLKITSASEGTKILGQVLNTVENLLERCVDGKANKKHAHEASKKAEKGADSEIDLDLEGEKAMHRLEEIAMYMMDYQDICEDYRILKEEEERRLKRSAGALYSPQQQPPPDGGGGEAKG